MAKPCQFFDFSPAKLRAALRARHNKSTTSQEHKSMQQFGESNVVQQSAQGFYKMRKDSFVEGHGFSRAANAQCATRLQPLRYGFFSRRSQANQKTAYLRG
jgi:hypothetical protein